MTHFRLLILILSTPFFTSCQTKKPNKIEVDPLLATDIIKQQVWVDSLYNTMTLREKVGQLFMVQLYSEQSEEAKKKVLKLIKEAHIGGIIYSVGGPMRQAKLNNSLQKSSKIPLLIGMDAEWGLNMRLDSTYAFPYNMALGAVKDKKLIERVGVHIGEHCSRLGVHFNFAPVVDINTNPDNPIIGNRSFGENRERVTQHALAFMKGMQSKNVLASAKHFPGHGDTSQDSHKMLPTINFDKKRLDSIELYPYKKLITQGVSSVMVAHLNIPALESRANYPSSLSKHIVTDILKDSLNFKGLIISDALDMKGAANFGAAGDIDLEAFKAGNDILLMSENVTKGIDNIINAYYNKEILETRLELSVKKILKAKYKVGLNTYQPTKTDSLFLDLNRVKDDQLFEEVVENSLTVIKNKDEIIPIKHLEKQKIAYVKLGNASGKVFVNELKKYTNVDVVKADNLANLITKLKPYTTVIVGFHKSNKNPWQAYKFSNTELVWLYEIARTKNTILNVFTKPYSLIDLKTTANFEAITIAYQNSDIAQQKAAQLLFGAIAAKGHLPVSVNKDFKQGVGLTTQLLDRLSYTNIPERVGMNSIKLKKVDSIAQRAVDEKMTPGLQLLIARHGKVFYNKTFGKHTYEGNKKVKQTDLYDVASLTKILATLPLIMELENKNIITLNTKLASLLPDYKGTDKENISIKKMLSHYAKLKPWIPLYLKTIDSVTKLPLHKFYRAKLSKDFNIKINNNLYLSTNYKDSIHNQIKDSELLEDLKYRYSDLPYYLLKDYIERVYNMPLDKLVQSHYYKALGANYTTYNPLNKFNKSKIVPSEMDTYFRHQKIHGYVHDPGAAMQNGVGGHAGIFSNANDVAKIMQMYLQKGYYGGKRYFSADTFDKFNTRYYEAQDNRRGVGFDKPQLNEVGPTCGCVSKQSFGHSGFTGTYTWADPETEIVYVFLANRTFPSAKINTLLRENIRTDIQQLINDAIDD